ncbi:hypothetical protein [Streptomyces sp. NPDC007172]|uniref:hypothetical protein n=1 Tax=Streptomyces sp. NPDC007172 TaxID=3364776 RepID=UPI00367E0068
MQVPLDPAAFGVHGLDDPGTACRQLVDPAPHHLALARAEEAVDEVPLQRDHGGEPGEIEEEDQGRRGEQVADHGPGRRDAVRSLTPQPARQRLSRRHETEAEDGERAGPQQADGPAARQIAQGPVRGEPATPVSTQEYGHPQPFQACQS